MIIACSFNICQQVIARDKRDLFRNEVNDDPVWKDIQELR